MQTEETSTTWLGQPALALETPAFRVVTVPGLGAKIVSLFDKTAGREWLLPPVERPFQPVAYAASFVDQDMSGWDEMFPTIDACAYPDDGPYRGAALPDHGEVWSLPWSIEASDNAISLTAWGRALPYRLTRTARMPDDRTLRLTYQAVNTGPEPFDALWAAHPQFAVDNATRIVLPPSVNRVVNVHAGEEFPTVGHTCSWPHAETASGQVMALDRIGPASLRRCRKFYTSPDTSVGWAALQQGANGNWLRLSWDAADVPYLGIWIDEGVYNDAPTAALEPSTGYYDRVTLAQSNGRITRFLPGEPRRWHLNIEVGLGTLGSSA